MNLSEGQLLELKKDLDCGIRTIKAGAIFEVVTVGYNVALSANGLGMGMFTKGEVEEYFKEYKEEKKLGSISDSSMNGDIEKVVQDSIERTTVITLKSGAIGIAKCLWEDEFDYQKGLEVAYIKAKIAELTNKLKEY